MYLKYLQTFFILLFCSFAIAKDTQPNPDCNNKQEIWMILYHGDFYSHNSYEKAEEILSRCDITADVFLSLEERVPPHQLAFLKEQNQGLDSPLISAIRREDEPRVKLFIDNGADVNHLGEHGYTPLMKAAKKGNHEIIELLLNKGADVNAVNAHGKIVEDAPTRAVLWYAKDVDVMTRLLNRGADPHLIGHPLLEKTVIRQGDAEAVAVLLNAGMKPNNDILNTAAYFSHSQRIEKTVLLLNAGADPDTVGPDNNPVLINVLEGGQKNTHGLNENEEKDMQETEQVAKLLINAGANLNAIQTEYPYQTALIIATIKGYPSVVELLLYFGADPFRRDAHNADAFDYAETIQKGIIASQWMENIDRERLTDVYNQILDSLQSHTPSSEQATTQ